MDFAKALLGGEKLLGIWGIGHIGYSTTCHFAEQGVRVLGYDIDPARAEAVNRGENPVFAMDYWLGFDPAYLFEREVARVTTDWKDMLDEKVAAHFICVPTERDGRPWLDPLLDVCAKIATSPSMRSKDPPLIIVESTLSPGTLDQAVIPLFEEKGIRVGQDLLLGCSPRRDWFATPDKSLRTLPRVFGGTTPATNTAMRQVLSIVCQELVEAPSHVEAEMTKAIENAYRQMDIALAFELSNAFPQTDMRNVLRLVGTKWNIESYFPSFGVGGYCIPLASHYLLEGADLPDELRLLHKLSDICDEQPIRVAESLVKRGAKKLGILGLSYTFNVRVSAQSPTLKLVSHLKEAGVEVEVNDPLYTAEEIFEICGAPSFGFPDDLERFDTVLVVSGHRQYRTEAGSALIQHLRNCKLILDNTGLWRDVKLAEHGIEYHLAGDVGWLAP
jgi:nucleotide sugar dehydrogenase